MPLRRRKRVLRLLLLLLLLSYGYGSRRRRGRFQGAHEGDELSDVFSPIEFEEQRFDESRQRGFDGDDLTNIGPRGGDEQGGKRRDQLGRRLIANQAQPGLNRPYSAQVGHEKAEGAAVHRMPRIIFRRRRRGGGRRSRRMLGRKMRIFASDV